MPDLFVEAFDPVKSPSGKRRIIPRRPGLLNSRYGVNSNYSQELSSGDCAAGQSRTGALGIPVRRNCVYYFAQDVALTAIRTHWREPEVRFRRHTGAP